MATFIETNPLSPSKPVLDAAPGRVLTFLAAVASVPEISEQLSASGFGPQAVDQAWDALHRVAGYRQPPVRAPDRTVFEAMRELEAWQSQDLRRFDAALLHLHPQAHAFVMGELEPGEGAGAVLTASTLLDRLDALEGDPSREASRQTDHSVLATVAARGLGPEERSRLRALVRKAQQFVPVAPGEPSGEAERAEGKRMAYAWWFDWSTTARAVITQRNHLIRLGLASRRRSDAGEVDGAAPPNAPPPSVAPTG